MDRRTNHFASRDPPSPPYSFDTQYSGQPSAPLDQKLGNQAAGNHHPVADNPVADNPVADIPVVDNPAVGNN